MLQAGATALPGMGRTWRRTIQLFRVPGLNESPLLMLTADTPGQVHGTAARYRLLRRQCMEGMRCAMPAGDSFPARHVGLSPEGAAANLLVRLAAAQ